MTKKMTTLAICIALSISNFAKPIVSSISAKKIHNANKEEPFQNPYITNGLIAMWDGEWNVGFGKHDEGVAYWKNLATGRQAELKEGNFAFDENSGIFDATGRLQAHDADYALIMAANNSGDMEIDCIFKCMLKSFTIGVYVAGYQYALNIAINYYYPDYRYNSNQGNIQGNHRGIQVTGGQEIIPLYAWIKDGIVYSEDKHLGTIGNAVTQNAMLPANGYFSIGVSSDLTKRFVGHIYCIRIYNRALTDEERTFNYTIDKERFGL